MTSREKYLRRERTRGLLLSILHTLLIAALVLFIVWWCAPASGETKEAGSAPQSGEPMMQIPHATTPGSGLTGVEPEAPEVWIPDAADVELLAKLIWGEARGCSTMEQAAVVWCVLNRVDSEERYFPDTIREVVLQKNQFTGYKEKHPATAEFKALAEDVLHRWHDENDGIGADDVGRVLPAEYVYFHGDGKVNWFRKQLKRDGNYWDWSLENPYEGVWQW